VSSLPVLKGDGGGERRIGDIWQWLGMNGGLSGTSGIARLTFLYSQAILAVVAGVVSTINVITRVHDTPQVGLAAPMIWEGSSWVSWLLFFWIPWIGYRLAPPFVRPRWKLLFHIPVGVAFALAHVLSFIALRKLAYALGGAS